MGRIEKLKRQLIKEANIRMLREQDEEEIEVTEVDLPYVLPSVGELREMSIIELEEYLKKLEANIQHVRLLVAGGDEGVVEINYYNELDQEVRQQIQLKEALSEINKNIEEYCIKETKKGKLKPRTGRTCREFRNRKSEIQRALDKLHGIEKEIDDAGDREKKSKNLINWVTIGTGLLTLLTSLLDALKPDNSEDGGIGI